MSELANLDFPKFRQAVLEEVRRGNNLSRQDKIRLERVHEELQAPETVLRWITVLNQLKTSVERQLGQRKAQLRIERMTFDPDRYDDAYRQYLRWRISTLRFLIEIEDRLAIARLARHEHFPREYPERVVAERNEVSDQLLWVMSQIRAHRDRTGGTLAPSEADMDLWSLLEEDRDVE